VALGDDLDLLESQIRMLQVGWDKFFGGVERRPPSELATKVDALIRRYAYAEIRNSAERFRYQALTARFNTFNELWNKRLRALEEGRPLGLHGLKADRLAEASAPAPTAAAPAAPRPGSEYRVRDAAKDEASLRGLFERFAQARQASGEPAVKFDSFRKLVSQQASRLIAERGAQAVDFRIETKDGKVSLKARPVR
jgi:hypothetical protein